MSVSCISHLGARANQDCVLAASSTVAEQNRCLQGRPPYRERLVSCRCLQGSL
jgi:hypothetical protein